MAEARRDATPASMATYYASRAAEYERVYAKPERQVDLRAMEAALAAPFAGRRVLEVACGTGWWTPHGAAQAAHWRATDLNPQTLAVARAKPGMPACVQFQTVDAYSFAGLGDPATEVFDAAFAGCWWSHVPLPALQPWLAALRAQLQPGAVVLLLDNRFVPGSSTPIHRQDADGNTYQWRHLDDGSTHEVVKNFPTPQAAIATVQAAGGHAARWTAYTHYWVLQYKLP